MSLADAGAKVTLAYRKERFERVKDRNRERLAEYVKRGRVALYLQAGCEELTPGEAVLSHKAGAAKVKDGGFVSAGKGGRLSLKNEFVFALLGAQAPRAFFERCGVEVKKAPLA